MEYDLYGMPIFKDSAGNEIPKSAVGNNLLFQGREYDPELNLYYYRARYYDPIMGRFLQTDPMGYADSMNLYQGFKMNPINFMDPFGKKVWIAARRLDLPIVGSFGVHTYILIMPDNPKDFGGKRKWAITGYPNEKNRLVLDPDNIHDRDYPISELKEFDEIQAPKGKSDTEFIKDILQTLKRYKQRREFSKYPNIENNEGNCNSLVTSILVGAGVPLEEIKKINPFGFNWGIGEVFPEMIDQKN